MRNLDETTLHVYKVLLEKFGEPIGERPTTSGVPDERESLKEVDKASSRWEALKKLVPKGSKTIDVKTAPMGKQVTNITVSTPSGETLKFNWDESSKSWKKGN